MSTRLRKVPIPLKNAGDGLEEKISVGSEKKKMIHAPCQEEMHLVNGLLHMHVYVPGCVLGAILNENSKSI